MRLPRAGPPAFQFVVRLSANLPRRDGHLPACDVCV